MAVNISNFWSWLDSTPPPVRASVWHHGETVQLEDIHSDYMAAITDASRRRDETGGMYEVVDQRGHTVYRADRISDVFFEED